MFRRKNMLEIVFLKEKVKESCVDIVVMEEKSKPDVSFLNEFEQELVQKAIKQSKFDPS